MKNFLLKTANRLLGWIRAHPNKALTLGSAIAAACGLPYVPPAVWSLIGALLGVD